MKRKEQPKAEMLFDYGVEGGGETLFRLVQEDGSYKFFTTGSSLRFDENDNDDIIEWKKEYSSWEEFWQKFSADSFWPAFYPIYIHDDCKPAIQASITSLPAEEIERHSPYRIDNWSRALNHPPKSTGDPLSKG